MLNVNEINFPITFKFPIQQSITFNNASSNGVWQVSREESNLPLEYFIEQHNKQNPYNEPHKRHYYEMAEKKEHNDTIDSIGYLFSNTGEARFHGAIFTASIGAKDYDYICDVELMPVGAILVGIQRECGEWDDLKFKPNRIEVHDDIICLLSGYAGFSKKAISYSAEINIKRGTKVKIKNSTNC